MSESCDRRVIRVGWLAHRPIHACGELLLIGAAPAPDRGVDIVVRLTVDADHLVDGIRPDRARFCAAIPRTRVRGVVLIAPAPTAEVRMLPHAETVREQI